MNKKESEDIAIDIGTYLDIAEKSNDAAEVANAATDMVKGILKRYPRLRNILWKWNQEHLLDKLGLDHGKPKITLKRSRKK